MRHLARPHISNPAVQTLIAIALLMQKLQTSAVAGEAMAVVAVLGSRPLSAVRPADSGR